MRAIRAMLATSLVGGPVALSSPPAAALPQGCQPIPGGYRCIYGPFDVAYGPNEFTAPATPIPEHGFITSAQATLLDEDGAPLPAHFVHLHHVVLVNLAERDRTCPNLYDRFFASGKERTLLRLPPGYGYYWSHEPPLAAPAYPPYWFLVADLDGGHPGESSSTYVQVDFGFTPAPEGALHDVTPVWLDVRNCQQQPVFDVPRRTKRPRYRERWTYTMPVGGEFVALAGHLHDGGVKVTLTDVGTGEVLFTSRARYEKRRSPWYLTAMTSFSGVPGVPVDAGDTLRLTAVYDSTHRWHDVMGIMVGMLASEA